MMPFIDMKDCAERETSPGFKGRFVHSEQMTLAQWSISEGSSSPEHAHPHEQLVIVLEGQFALTVAGETRVLVPGTVVVVPSGVAHSAKAITSCRVIDIFCPVREDFR